MSPISDLLKHRSLGVVVSVMALVHRRVGGNERYRNGHVGRTHHRASSAARSHRILSRRVSLQENSVSLASGQASQSIVFDGTTRIQCRQGTSYRCVESYSVSMSGDAKVCQPKQLESFHSVRTIDLIVKHGDDLDKSLKIKASSLLGRYIQIRDANMRYLV